jgi:hypothetical protein
MRRQPVEVELLGLKVTTTPLAFSSSQPLIPDIAQLLAVAARELSPLFKTLNPKAMLDDTRTLMAIAPALGGIAGFLDGKLEKLAPRILASTVVVMANLAGEKQAYELGKERDRNEVFDEHPELYFPVLLFAGKVTFARFFPVSVLAASATSAPES